MVAGLLGNESSDSNRFTLVTPKSENDVRLQATLGNQNPTGLPVGVVSPFICILIKELFMSCIGMVVIKKTGEVHGAVWHGKVATFMLDFMIIVHIVFYNISYTLSTVLTTISTLLILLSFYLYAKENINILKKVG